MKTKTRTPPQRRKILDKEQHSPPQASNPQERRKTMAKRNIAAANVEPSGSKRISSSTDEPTAAARAPKRLKQSITEMKQKYHKILCRSRSKQLIETLSSLSDAQKKVVTEMGFGQLMEWKVDMIPTRLSYWILENFNAVACSLELNGYSVKIVEDDVEAYLGFSRGPKKIVLQEQIDDDLLLEFMAQFSGGFSKATNKTLACMLKESKVTDEWFKRNIVVLIYSSVIESHPNGKINTKILDVIRDTNKIAEYDWCDFVLRVLVEEASPDNKNTYFSGPILLLVMIYVDIMVIKNKESERTFPVIKAWDFSLLKARERLEIRLLGFGKGHVRDIAKVEKQPQVHTSKDDLNCKIVGENEGSLLGFLDNYFSEGMDLALAMRKFMKLMKSAPAQLSNNDIFNKANKAIQRMLNIKVNGASQKLPTTEEDGTLSQQEFLAAAERCMEEVERTIEERKRWEEEIPSLDLGIDFQIEEGNNNTEKYTEQTDGEKSEDEQRTIEERKRWEEEIPSLDLGIDFQIEEENNNTEKYKEQTDGEKSENEQRIKDSPTLFRLLENAAVPWNDANHANKLSDLVSGYINRRLQEQEFTGTPELNSLQKTGLKELADSNKHYNDEIMSEYMDLLYEENWHCAFVHPQLLNYSKTDQEKNIQEACFPKRPKMIFMPVLSRGYWTSMIGLVSSRVIYVAITADEETNYEAYAAYKSYHVNDSVKRLFDRISTGHSQWTVELVAGLPKLSSYDSGPFALKFMQCCAMGYRSSSFPDVKIERKIICWEILIGRAISSVNYNVEICYHLDNEMTHSPPKKLLILDLDGVLICGEGTMQSYIAFLRFCAENFVIAVWSSKQKIISISQEFERRGNLGFLFHWNQDKCTISKKSVKGNPNKKIMFKDLNRVWSLYKEYNASNTILVDDSPYKSYLNPEYTSIFPKPVNYLAPGKSFVKYLRQLAAAENTQEYIKANPFDESDILNPEEKQYYRSAAEELSNNFQQTAAVPRPAMFKNRMKWSS